MSEQDILRRVAILLLEVHKLRAEIARLTAVLQEAECSDT